MKIKIRITLFIMFIIISIFTTAYNFNDVRQINNQSIINNINLTFIEVEFIDETFTYYYNSNKLIANPDDLGEFVYVNQMIIGIIELEEVNTCYNEYNDLRRCFNFLVNGNQPFEINEQTIIPLAYQLQEQLNFHLRDSFRVRDNAINREERINGFMRMRMRMEDLNITIG